MAKRAIIFPIPDHADVADLLAQTCDQVGFSTERSTSHPPEQISSVLPNQSCVLFIPSQTDDCLGVKLIQVVSQSRPSHIACLYGPLLPEATYISLAFREGASDVIALDVEPTALRNQVQRAFDKLGELQSAQSRDSLPRQEFESALRARKLHPRIHVIAWSSSADTETRMLAPGTNVDACVPKRTDDGSALLLTGALLRALAI